MKYLPFYNKCIKSGKIPDWGLCYSFHGNSFFQLIDPENGRHESYWGYSESVSDYVDYVSVRTEFTPLRQNIVLLMAAMNNEL